MKSKFFLTTFSIIFSIYGEGGVRITTEPLKKNKMIEEGDKTLGAGGSFGIVTFENLTTKGLLKLNGTTVKQTLYVNGSLLTQGANLHNVEVLGEANFKNTIIEEKTHVMGSLRAEKSLFKDHLTIHGVKALFIACQIGSIKVLKEPSFKGSQVLELKQKTIVDGPIVFEAGKGEIHCYPGSYVLGIVTGAKIVRKN